jgi:polysaccharide pyruvyl transferase WcaK-like protein
MDLFTLHPEQDRKYGLDQIYTLQEDYDRPCPRGSLSWFLSSVQIKLTGKIDLVMRFRKKALLSGAKRGDIFLSVGGDNYCYAGTDLIAATHRNLRKKSAKTVLWGCSVEPELLNNPAIAEDLSSYDLITARESISYAALKTVNPNTVLVADPAFLLDRKDLPLPEGWIEGNMIGINASPLILQNGRNSSLVLDAYKALIQHILDTTDSSVALIPHVVCKNNDDRIPLRILHEAFRVTGRVIFLEDHNCMELKGYIARCRMFIGARTHATIAAYSSCVPTLVLGYSVKSRGIARELFGTEENYVIPVQGLQDTQDLARGFDWLKKHETDIRCHLEQFMPTYKKRALLAGEATRRLLAK